MASRFPSQAPSDTDTAAERRAFNIDLAANPLVLDAVLEQVPGLLWTVDADLHCRYVSRPAPPGFGLEVARRIGPAQAVAHGRALAGEVVYYEVDCDGRLFSCRVGPVSDASGTVGGLVGSAQEIGAVGKCDADPAALPPPGAFHSMLEHAAEGLAILDAEGRFIFMNAAARRLADVEPIGTAITQGSAVWGEWVDGAGIPMPPEDWPLVRALRGDVTQGSEIGKVRADGSSFHILFSAAPVRDSSGAIIGAIASFTDITARKRSEEAMRAINDELEARVRVRTAELQRAEEQARHHQAELAHVLRVHTMGQMVASLAHEINQPLGAIANYAQGCKNWLQSEEPPKEKLLEAVEQIAGEAVRAGEITRRVRDLIRKDRAKRKHVDPNAIARNALAIAAPSARGRDVTLSLDATADLPHVRVDAIQIEQVLLNLLLNGIDAVDGSEPPRQVTIRTRSGKDVVEIAVIDSGRGIAPADEERLFEPFFTTKANGLGMGLAISRSIVEAHGGRIWVEGRAGAGACICFSLPAAGAR